MFSSQVHLYSSLLFLRLEMLLQPKEVNLPELPCNLPFLCAVILYRAFEAYLTRA